LCLKIRRPITTTNHTGTFPKVPLFKTTNRRAHAHRALGAEAGEGGAEGAKGEVNVVDEIVGG
jgi:hypothetical protein